MRKVLLAAGMLLLLASQAGGVRAAFREEQLNLPVKVTAARGKQVERTLTVMVFSDPANPQPAPVMVLNHGRSSTAAGRREVGRARFTEASRFFVQRGFIVAVPTRIGYGVTGGDDIESTGGCGSKDYPPGYSVAAQQTLAVLAKVRERADAAKDRAVVAGISFGGTTAITIAALNSPGVQAGINFAGGGGGDPKGRPQNPCGQPALKKLFADYGKTAKIPTLWVYAENDMYFGPRLPRVWFDAYRAAGGPGEFVMFAPHGEDGHGLFTRAPQVWQPRVAEFLSARGFPQPPPRSGN
jgi:dienelactone hydrolase